ncbi:MAG: hypothetical protein AAGJ38_03030 [Planctomycetota bacterium]
MRAKLVAAVGCVSLCVWSNAATLTFFSGTDEAKSISDDGWKIAGTYDNGEGFRYTPTTGFELIGGPGAATQGDHLRTLGSALNLRGGMSANGQYFVGQTIGQLNQLTYGALALDTLTLDFPSSDFLTPGDLQAVVVSDVSDSAIAIGNAVAGNGAFDAYKYDVFAQTRSNLLGLSSSENGFKAEPASVASIFVGGLRTDIVVGSSPLASGSSRAVMWNGGITPTNLGVLSGHSDSYAYDISTDGTTVVGVNDMNGPSLDQTGFYWEGAGMVALSHLSSDLHDSSLARGVSANGDFIVGSSFQATNFQVGSFEAVLWDSNRNIFSIKNLLLSEGIDVEAMGYDLLQATSISADGRVIIGVGSTPSSTVQDPYDVWVVDLGVEVADPLLGDYNDSGQVEQGDLNLVLNNWGSATPPIPAGWVNDLPDGFIDQNELNRVLNNWGNQSAPLTSPLTVPEPASLLIGGTLFVLLRRRRGDI